MAYTQFSCYNRLGLGFSLSYLMPSSSLALQSFSSSCANRNRNSTTCWGCNEGFGACTACTLARCAQHWASADWPSSRFVSDGVFPSASRLQGSLGFNIWGTFPHPQCSFAKKGSPRASWVNMEDAGYIHPPSGNVQSWARGDRQRRRKPAIEERWFPLHPKTSRATPPTAP